MSQLGQIISPYIGFVNSLNGLTGNINLTAGSDISITPIGQNIKISFTGATLLPWTPTPGCTAAIDNGYISDNGALLTVILLPVTYAVGDIIAVVGASAGGWKLAQPAGTTIHIGSSGTTRGTNGYLKSTGQYDCVELICIIANSDWVIRNSSCTVLLV
jgi:hypothetical protein